MHIGRMASFEISRGDPPWRLVSGKQKAKTVSKEQKENRGPGERIR
jgi:hypothetical protein